MPPPTTDSPASTSRLVEPEKLDYSRIYLDFVAGRKPASEFYPALSPEEVAADLGQTGFDRGRMVEILRRQNLIYAASSASMANLERLLDKRAVCVFAGQQAGLFGGPLLTLVKALSIVKTARRYSEQLNRPIVPMFWISGDDHDLEEADHTFVLTRQGEICKNSYQTAPAAEIPTSEIRLNDPDELDRAIGYLRECLGESDFTDDLYELISRSFTTDDTLVTAFGKFMAALTGDLGLVLFSPGDVEAKRLAAPFFRAIIEKRNEVHDTLAATNLKIERAGYHLQVDKKGSSTHLFYNLDGRQPVRRQGERFTVGDTSFSREDLLARISEHPEKFSPDVITRPVFQSYLFPVMVQLGGPAEIAYLAQLNPLFELFDLPAPVDKARPTLTLVEKRGERLMQQLNIRFEDFLGDVEQVINRVMAESFPVDLETDFETLRKSVASQFRTFIDRALAFDQGLTQSAGQMSGKVDFILKGFESKLFAAHKKKSRQTRDRIYRLNNALCPHHELQERTLNITYFLARYGLDLTGYIYDRMDPEQTAHQLISLAEYEQ